MKINRQKFLFYFVSILLIKYSLYSSPKLTSYSFNSSGDKINCGNSTLLFSQGQSVIGESKNAKKIQIGFLPSLIDDTLPPRTELGISDKRYSVSGSTYVTSETSFSLSAADDLVAVGDGIGLGVKSVKWRVVSDMWQEYEEPFNIAGEDGIYRIEYYSEDVIGNRELIKSSAFWLDNTPPETQLAISGKSCAAGGKTYVTSETVFQITASDFSSGVKETLYSLDAGLDNLYTGSFTLAERREDQWRDEFNAGRLSSDWSFVREVPEKWTLSGDREHLVIYTEEGSLRQDNNDQQNLILRDFPYLEGDWVVETKLEFSPGISGQEAGIYLYYDDENYLKLVKAYQGGRRVLAGKEIDGVYEETEYDLNWFQEETLYLRVKKEEDFRLYTSTNGLNWIKVGSFNLGEVYLTKAGLGAANGVSWQGVDSIPAKFEYFSMHRQEESVLQDGEHEIAYYSRDNLDNQEPRKSFTLFLDNTAPEISITSPSGGEEFVAQRDLIEISFSVHEEGPYSYTAYLEVVDARDATKIGSKYYVDIGDQIDPQNLPVYGSYVLRIEAEDWASHQRRVSSAQFEVIWDIQPPRTALAVSGKRYEVSGSMFVTSETGFNLSAEDDLLETGDGLGLGVERTEYQVNREQIVEESSWIVYSGLFPLLEEESRPEEDPACAGVWRLEEGTGQAVSDLSGNGNTGYLGSGSGVDSYDPVWTSNSREGSSALSFSEKKTLQVADSSFLRSWTGAGGFTIEMWVYPTQFTSSSNDYSILIAHGMNGGYQMYLDPGTRRLRFAYFQTPSWEGKATDEVLELNRWHHIAAVYQVIDGVPTIKIYVDGQKVLEDVFTSGEMIYPKSGEPLYIGSNRDYASSGRSFRGDIDEVALYSRALTGE